MATVSSPAAGLPEEPAAIGPVGRILGALFSPKATFADIARRPSWVAPIVLLGLLGLVVCYGLNQKMDWGSFIRQKAEQNPRFAQLSEAQKQQALGTQIKIAPITAYVFGGVGALLGALILSAIYLGAFNLFTGAQLRYGASFGITAHAFVPSAIASVLGIVIVFLKKAGDVDPENLVASNLGALVGSDAPKWLHSLGSSIEVFWIWIMVLLAIGFRAANPKKISMGSALGIVLGLWAVWLCAKVGWAAIFS